MALGGALALAFTVAAMVPSGTVQLAGRAQQGGLMFGTLPHGATALTLDGLAVSANLDGRFVIGFGRDAIAAAELGWRDAAGNPLTKTITVLPRDWPTQSLPTLAPKPVPDAEFDSRRPAELAKIAAARSGTSAVAGWAQAFIVPAVGAVTGVFGSQRILSGEPQAPRSGIDIGAAESAPVVAPADGVVRLADGPFTLEGNLVILDHGLGVQSVLMHLSRIDVTVGQMLRRGDPVGQVGATGRATGPHLHWGMTWSPDGKTIVRVDPAQLVVAR